MNAKKIITLKGNDSISADRVNINYNFQQIVKDVIEQSRKLDNLTSSNIPNESNVDGPFITQALNNLLEMIGSTGSGGNGATGPTGATGPAGENFDSESIHKNISNEFDDIDEEDNPDINSRIIIEDTNGDKKVVSLSNLPFSDNPGASGLRYAGATPTNVKWGAIQTGTDLTGLSFQEIVELATIEYQLPEFISFSISGQSTVIEVGELLQGNKTFVWNTSNSNNIVDDSIDIVDRNTSTTIASGLTNDGNEIVPIGNVINTSPITQTYEIVAENTEEFAFDRTYTINSIYPYFYGTFSSGGVGAGLNRPSASFLLIDNIDKASKVLSSSTGTINISFNSDTDDYLFFAIPSISPNKNAWFINTLNSGNIGGSVTPGGNLFPDPETINIDSPNGLWSGVEYTVYISNFQTEVRQNMQLRN